MANYVYIVTKMIFRKLSFCTNFSIKVSISFKALAHNVLLSYGYISVESIDFFMPLIPTCNITDSDDRDLSSRLGPLSLSHGKRPPAPLPPPVGNNLSEGRHISQARPPALDLPNRSDRSKQPAPPSFSGYSSHSSHQSFPKESHALPELSLNSSASSQPFINLGNGEHIELTPLYRKIMEKPYFQFISRAKAKELVMQGK